MTSSRRAWFGRLVVPAIILQSVLIGGGYATGREVVEYGAKYGAAGWVAVGCIFLGFALVSVLTFEFARTLRAYDYKGFMKGLIGPFWPLFDLLFAVMATVVIAVMISAATSIAEQTLGLSQTLVTIAAAGCVGLLSFYGSRYIERFKIAGTAALYIAYLLFAALVLSGDPGASVASPAASGGTVDEPSLLSVAGSGVLYVGYNLVVFPTVLFALHRQETRRDSVVGGLLAGLLMTVPFVITFLCVLKFYPATEVLEAPVPWLVMLESTGGTAVVVVFGVVMAWTLIETSVGLIHAILERVDADLKAGEAAPAESTSARSASGLSRLQRGALGIVALLVAVALSKIGIITLVAEGYSIMAYVFIGLYAIPLMTVGLKRLGQGE